MSDEMKSKAAQNMFSALCAFLDEKKLKYQKDEEDLTVNFAMEGKSFPLEFVFIIDEKRDLIRIHSPISAQFVGERLLDGAIAACQVNWTMADGSFDYDYRKGIIWFRLTSSYKDSLISKDVFFYMLSVALYAMEEYNDKFFLLSKGEIDIEEFFKD